MEDMWGIELSINHTVSNNLLHHFLFRSVTVALSDKSSFFNFRMWSTFGIVGAFVSLGLSLVWSAFFGNQVTVFSKETVEEWPSTITTFVHIVACHHELWREHWHVFTIFESQTLFNNLSERNSIAGTAMSLISMFGGEIDSFNISPVKVSWELTFWNILSASVFLIFSSFIPSSSKILLLSKSRSF
jgi:hypothetical protein